MVSSRNQTGPRHCVPENFGRRRNIFVWQKKCVDDRHNKNICIKNRHYSGSTNYETSITRIHRLKPMTQKLVVSANIKIGQKWHLPVRVSNRNRFYGPGSDNLHTFGKGFYLRNVFFAFETRHNGTETIGNILPSIKISFSVDLNKDKKPVPHRKFCEL